VAATTEQSQRFLDAYEIGRGMPFTADERQVAWAAGTWVLAFNAKKESVTGNTGPYQDHLFQDHLFAERDTRASCAGL
jgi:hypothetical protein